MRKDLNCGYLDKNAHEKKESWLYQEKKKI